MSTMSQNIKHRQQEPKTKVNTSCYSYPETLKESHCIFIFLINMEIILILSFFTKKYTLSKILIHLDCKEIQSVHPKADQSWVFIGRTDVEAETPILWPTDAKSWLIGKGPDARKDWGQEEKGTTEDEMGWMTSPTQWTWVWVDSGSWWWTRRPGVLRFMG